MKKLLWLALPLLIGCNSEKKEKQWAPVSGVEIEILLEDSLSIRALEVMGSSVGFAGSEGHYGLYNSATQQVGLQRQAYDTLYPEFRAVGSTSEDFFMLSVASPALLYKTGEQGEMELVYKEEHEKVFYDAMDFWDDQEGIAMGDPVEDCLSVIITRDGGQSWQKLSCDLLPPVVGGEAAFAASDSNVEVEGDSTWIITGGMASRVFFSPDRGRSWEVFDTPIISGEATTGAYSLDFYDGLRGIIIGGDYLHPDGNSANKAVTSDGGRTWQLVADGQHPGYKSSVRYLPGSDAREILAVGFTGISYSQNGGADWEHLSDEGFYTLRFLNDSTAYAAGKGRLARLRLKR